MTELSLPNPQLPLQNSLSSKVLEQKITTTPWLRKTSEVRRTMPFSPRFTTRVRLKFPSDISLSRTPDTPCHGSSFSRENQGRGIWEISSKTQTSSADLSTSNTLTFSVQDFVCNYKNFGPSEQKSLYCTNTGKTLMDPDCKYDKKVVLYIKGKYMK